MQRRRTVLLGCLVALSGCVDDLGLSSATRAPTSTPPEDSDGDGVPDHADDYPEDSEAHERVFRAEKTVTLEPGEYWARSFSVPGDDNMAEAFVEIDLTVEGGLPVDLLLARGESFDEIALSDLSASDHSIFAVEDITHEEQIGADDWVIAVDNTEEGETSPQETVTVQFAFDVGLIEPA